MKRLSGTADNAEAVDHIADGLTDAQKRLLVGCLVEGREDEERVLVDGNERSIRALMVRSVPLIRQDGRIRILTPLGLSVARRLRTKPESFTAFTIEL